MSETDCTPTTTPLWVLLGLVSKRDGLTITNSGVAGWRVTSTKDEAVGSFVHAIERAKPGFAIDEIVCTELPPEEMRRALGLESAS